MGNLIDYIYETELMTLEELPLGEVDFLALAQFAYLKLKNMVPGMASGRRGITIGALASHPGRWGLFRELWFAKENVTLLEAMGQSRRFRDILLRDYAEVLDKRRDTQFAAVTYDLGKGKFCIAFRGTDETLTGWKEDFNMAFYSRVPAQELARTYLRQEAGKCRGEIYVTGHSKGGNLAFYGARHVPLKIKEKIRAVYNFDGPGLGGKAAYLGMEREKLVKVVPKQSIIGMLFEEEKRYQVIESESAGLMQHNPFLWRIENNEFLRSENQKPANEAMMKWFLRRLKQQNREQQKALLERLYSLIAYTGEDSFWKIGTEWKRILPMIVSALREQGENGK